MVSKLIVLCSLVALTCGASIRPVDRQTRFHRLPSWENQYRQQDQEYSEPDYSYSYAVQDSWTGDFKSQQESRRGDQVRGQYRMMESDGRERIVDYSADDWNGFNAIVRHHPNTAVLTRAIPVISSVDVDPDYAVSNARVMQYLDTPVVISNHQIRHG
ncbi:larval cuticle protein A3A-like [Uranotaenia lowii]|uniref:larval cuticle protein A3A-like n=1 Tax=Uranotaenia lowii TaxID=190385 RepID=UPI0024799EFF|nr:larval cuticle protein A3A-like [Uranotaenia lowii]